MGGERIQFSDFFVKEWDAEFSRVKDYEPWSKRRREAGDADGDDFGAILRESDDVPDCIIEDIEEFVRGASCLTDLNSVQGAAGERRCVWIDDRSSTSPSWPRDYKDRVTTATGVYRLLQRSRFDADGLPDADRRLMHFRFLDPHIILALAQTAPQREIPFLRSGIWNHLASQTSIRANFTEGYLFQMEIHLPILELITNPKPERPCQPGTKYPTREWIDLEFLNISSGNGSGPAVHGLRRSHFSFFVSVSDPDRWVGCSFLDKYFTDDDEELEGDVFPDEGMHVDPISNGEQDANIPIRDSKEYFLLILKIQMKVALKQWFNLTKKIKRAIEQYNPEHSSTSSKDFAHNGCQAEALEKAFRRTQRTMKLLSQLLTVLSDTIKAWQGFSSPNGDIEYFLCDQDVTSCMKKSRIAQSIFAINQTVQKMENLKGELETLREGCHQSSQAVSQALNFAANHAARNNGLLSEFTMSIIAPLMLIIAYYSIPSGSVPFKLDPKYFTVATVIIMLALRLLFVAICAFPVTSLRWKESAKLFAIARPDFAKFSRLWTRQRVIQDGSARREEEGGSSAGNL